jgi:localization factor PodJL
MAGPGIAKAGQSGPGGHDLDIARESPADETVRATAPAAGPTQEPPDSFSLFGNGQTEAEAQLQAYYAQLAAQQPPRFPPFEELSARLKEFGLSHDGRTPFLDAKPQKAPDRTASAGEAFRSDLDWFEHRFGELKQLLTWKDDGVREIATINVKLADISGRLDKLSSGMPDATAIAAVETKLTNLSRSLEETREQSAVDADRISRAAMEILAASNRTQEDRRRFETVARHTIEELGQTVVATASRAAVLTAGEMAVSLQRQPEGSGVECLEQELRILNAQSRESSERTTAALDRMHETLRTFLERAPSGPSPSAPPKKRPTIGMPIGADSSVYSLTDNGFGSAFSRKPQPGTVPLRRPVPSDTDLITGLQEAEERLNKSRAGRAPIPESDPDIAQPSFFRATRVREDDKSHPLAGITAVAIILLLASAALYYLHTKTHLASFHLSLTPEKTLTSQRQVKASAPLTVPPADAPVPAKPGQNDGMRRSEDPYPALFTAASKNAQASEADESPTEDLKILESAARHGDREAQFRIGKRFLNDSDVDGGPATAARWLARAADQDHLEALFMLASLYERGAGVSKDEEHAIGLYRKAASAGHIRAMHNLGVLLSARGSAVSYKEAAMWFNRAALAGLADSQYNLALLYERGLGLEQDLTRAYFWYRVAAHSGDKEAVQQAERLKRTMPPEETAAAGEQAGAWSPALEDSVKSAGEGTAHRG